MGSYKKKLFIVLLLFLLISFFVCSSVNATGDEHYQSFDTYVVDSYQLLQKQQDILCKVFLIRFDANATEVQKEELRTYIRNSGKWFYFTYTVGQSNNPRINLYIPNNSVDFSALDQEELNTSFSLFFDDYTTIPVTGYTLSSTEIGGNVRKFTVQLSTSGISISNTNETVFYPTFCIFYISPYLTDYANGISPNNSGFSMILNAINENTDATEDSTQAVNNLRNDFNEEESDSDYDFPTSNPTTDPTSSGIDNIFNMFYMRINSWNALGINVPIPFTGKSFTISPDITENIINGWTPTTQIATVFKTLLSGVWYYLLGRYIVKDVQHYVDGLQTGDILTKSDTNVKTEML